MRTLANSKQYLLGTVTVLGATYIYSIGDAGNGSNSLRPPPINVTEYKRNGEKSYFDLESIASVNRSPLPRGDAFSTSRPGTPTFERRPIKSSELLTANKRA
jgi:hypothetical protein